MTGHVLPFDPAAHNVADALLPWFVNGTLDGDELALVEQHLGNCTRCQCEVEWLRDLHAACVAGEAAPGASNAFRNLRLRLEEPRQRRREIVRASRRERPWARWVIGAQLAVIAALGMLWLQDGDHAAAYRTLGTTKVASPTAGALVVVFDPTTSESELRRILRSAGARVVDGPTQENAYVLDVPAKRRDQALRTLRAERAVALAEQLDPASSR